MIAGCVEHLSQEKVSGWALDTGSADPVVVEVLLRDRVIRRLHARNDRIGFRSFPNRGRVGFSFHIGSSLLPYIHSRTDLTFRVAGEPLPVERMRLQPLEPELRKDPAELLARLDAGHIVTKKGEVRLSIHLDPAWQEKVLAFYADCRRKFAELFGHDLSITYGTLLGFERNGDFIPGDDDFDTCYLSRHSEPAKVKRELIDVIGRLLAAGESIELGYRGRLFRWKSTTGVGIDVFPSWIRGGRYFLSFAVGCWRARAIREGFLDKPFKSARVLVPAKTEEILSGIYGPEWRTPDPLFQWFVREPVAREIRKIHLSEAETAEVYWQQHYARSGAHSDPSPFAHAALRWVPREIRGVIDLGCGDGRDTYFVGQGKPTLGIDYSSVATEKNRAAYPRERFPRLDFLQSDVRDAERLVADTRAFLAATHGPVALYARFFLHAIDDAAEGALLEFCQRALPPRSRVLLEFRTTLDQALGKTFGEHYRRFVDPAALAQRMGAVGFVLQHHEEGRGYARYGDEDPHIARMVFVKPAHAS
jgi:hypothetical protein